MSRAGRPPLRARFVRTVGERDKVYVRRSDGSETSWVFPTYGDVHTSQIAMASFSDVMGSRAGTNSCDTKPLKPVSAIARQIAV